MMITAFNYSANVVDSDAELQYITSFQLNGKKKTRASGDSSLLQVVNQSHERCLGLQLYDLRCFSTACRDKHARVYETRHEVQRLG